MKYFTSIRRIRFSFAFAALIGLSAASKAAPLPGYSIPPGIIPPPVTFPVIPKPILKLPDLIISSFVVGAPVRQSNGEFRVRFAAAIENAGLAPAGRFAVGSYFMDPSFAGGQWFYRKYEPVIAPGVTMTFDGNAQVERLNPGSLILVKGEFSFGPAAQGRTIYLRLHADNSESTEFLPSHVRVKELNEANNFSPIVAVTFPD